MSREVSIERGDCERIEIVKPCGCSYEILDTAEIIVLPAGWHVRLPAEIFDGLMAEGGATWIN